MIGGSKKLLGFCAVFIAICVVAIGFLIKVQKDEVPGGFYLKLVNKTNYSVNVYSSTEHKTIIPSLQPGEKKFVGPFDRKIGAKDSFVRFKAKRWDRPVTFKFKDHETLFSKKVVLDRKKKGKTRGKVISIRVQSVWQKFAKNKGYEVTVEEIGPHSLPNFGVLWEKYITAPFKSSDQKAS